MMYKILDCFAGWGSIYKDRNVWHSDVFKNDIRSGEYCFYKDKKVIIYSDIKYDMFNYSSKNLKNILCDNSVNLDNISLLVLDPPFLLKKNNSIICKKYTSLDFSFSKDYKLNLQNMFKNVIYLDKPILLKWNDKTYDIQEIINTFPNLKSIEIARKKYTCWYLINSNKQTRHSLLDFIYKTFRIRGEIKLSIRKSGGGRKKKYDCDKKMVKGETYKRRKLYDMWRDRWERSKCPLSFWNWMNDLDVERFNEDHKDCGVGNGKFQVIPKIKKYEIRK